MRFMGLADDVDVTLPRIANRRRLTPPPPTAPVPKPAHATVPAGTGLYRCQRPPEEPRGTGARGGLCCREKMLALADPGAGALISAPGAAALQRGLALGPGDVQPFLLEPRLMELKLPAEELAVVEVINHKLAERLPRATVTYRKPARSWLGVAGRSKPLP